MAAKLGKLSSSQAMLFVCDVQERFRGVISHMPYVVDTARRLVRPHGHACSGRADTCFRKLQAHDTIKLSCHAQIRGAEALQVPVVVTEQYPQALGHTVVELRGVLPNNTITVSKTAFTMLGEHTPTRCL